MQAHTPVVLDDDCEKMQREQPLSSPAEGRQGGHLMEELPAQSTSQPPPGSEAKLLREPSTCPVMEQQAIQLLPLLLPAGDVALVQVSSAAGGVDGARMLSSSSSSSAAAAAPSAEKDTRMPSRGCSLLRPQRAEGVSGSGEIVEVVPLPPQLSTHLVRKESTSSSMADQQQQQQQQQAPTLSQQLPSDGTSTDNGQAPTFPWPPAEQEGTVSAALSTAAKVEVSVPTTERGASTSSSSTSSQRPSAAEVAVQEQVSWTDDEQVEQQPQAMSSTLSLEVRMLEPTTVIEEQLTPLFKPPDAGLEDLSLPVAEEPPIMPPTLSLEVRMCEAPSSTPPAEQQPAVLSSKHSTSAAVPSSSQQASGTQKPSSPLTTTAVDHEQQLMPSALSLEVKLLETSMPQAWEQQLSQPMLPRDDVGELPERPLLVADEELIPSMLSMEVKLLDPSVPESAGDQHHLPLPSTLSLEVKLLETFTAPATTGGQEQLHMPITAVPGGPATGRRWRHILTQVCVSALCITILPRVIPAVLKACGQNAVCYHSTT
ncbi:hypothetical protein VOLCADRAFT_100098 [Volvox carteri f. nagariensis]|uniref:Uncharacterized protein n=1 Tax=Volvox carteri f. nagariensis TaxID=3068 RepID=D8UJF3_VOLCA|nr:uncharacterized protein VOLCADRAFT_100098 [Volvox carteri f. nagariensis]EFJ40131.1 hypothetical protein VOLCADRAFT_100098 [Volvox carteri f. nagariensis]|eukprot:XP_002958788.1 hypothetical protein VOLCADRAFT_100098 [Volvox carteri f. nagariensis]